MKGAIEHLGAAFRGDDGESTGQATPDIALPSGRDVAANDDGRGDKQRRLTYQPALDGMRGLAVAAVLAYHADLTWAKGGFLGVDAFFVLSGYLITSLLLVEWRSAGKVDVGAFWARRFRRLLPALFLMLAGVAVYAVAFAEAEELDKIRGDALATIAYFANWHYILSDASYFDQFTTPSPLRHTWSLAIEEQFYIVWPLVLMALLWFWRSSPRMLIASTVALVVGSAALMAVLYEPSSDPSRIYYGTDTRAQSLLVGAVLAMVLIWYKPIRTGAARLLLGLVALASAVSLGWLWATVPDDSGFLYRGGYLLLAAAVALVIAAVVQPKRSLLSKALSFEPLRRFGIISYGVYLWHWPVYVLLDPERTGLDGPVLLIVRVSVTLAVAVASYYLVEAPIRHGPLRWPRVSWAIAPAAAAALAVVFVLATQGGAPQFLAVIDTESASDALTRAEATRAARILLVGDSVASSMSAGISELEEELHFVLLDVTMPGCGILPGDVIAGEDVIDGAQCQGVPSIWGRRIDEFRPDVVVVVASNLDGFAHNVDGRQIEASTPLAERNYQMALQEAIDILSRRGASIAMLTAPYVGTFTIAKPETDWLNELTLAVASENAEVTALDLNRFVSPDGTYTRNIDGIQVRSGDGVHFSEEGANLVGRWLAPRIIPIATDPLSEVVSASAGSVHTCSIAGSSGNVHCWGLDWFGAVGKNTLEQCVSSIGSRAPCSRQAVEVEGLADIVDVALGLAHSCALGADGQVSCWGRNDHGQLGDGTLMDHATPRNVCADAICERDLSDVVAISAGTNQTCAIVADGGMKCWGMNDMGQLGNASSADSAIPVDVSGVKGGVTAMAVGDSHTCAATIGGVAYCWGANGLGQLGDGTTVSRSTAVAVVGPAAPVAELAAGSAHTCALTTDGKVSCWGQNAFAQLGDAGTAPIQAEPVSVCGNAACASPLEKVSAISAGLQHTCVVTAGGVVKCWGDDQPGVESGRRAAPARITALATGASGVAVGALHACAVMTVGSVECWGLGATLGDGTDTTSATPVEVVRLSPPRGDANCDGVVDATDAVPVLERDAGLSASSGCSTNVDLDGSGRADSSDAALILQFASTLLQRLPR